MCSGRGYVYVDSPNGACECLACWTVRQQLPQTLEVRSLLQGEECEIDNSDQCSVPAQTGTRCSRRTAHSLCERRTHSQHWAAAAVLHRKLRVNIASSCSAPVFLKQCDFTTSARSKWRSTIARPTTAACCCGPTSFWTLVRITSLLQLSQFSLRTCFLPGAAIDNQLRDAIIGLHEDAGNANVTGPLNFAAATAFIAFVRGAAAVCETHSL